MAKYVSTIICNHFVQAGSTIYSYVHNIYYSANEIFLVKFLNEVHPTIFTLLKNYAIATVVEEA